MDYLHLVTIAVLLTSAYCAPKKPIKLTNDEIQLILNFAKSDSFKSCLGNLVKDDSSHSRDSSSSDMSGEVGFKRCTRRAFNSFLAYKKDRTLSGMLESFTQSLFEDCMPKVEKKPQDKTILILSDSIAGDMGSDEINEMGICVENTLLSLFDFSSNMYSH